MNWTVKKMAIIVGVFALLFVIPLMFGMDLWEFSEEYIHKDAGLWLNIIFGTLFVIGFIFYVPRIIVAIVNTTKIK